MDWEAMELVDLRYNNKNESYDHCDNVFIRPIDSFSQSNQ